MFLITIALLSTWWETPNWADGNDLIDTPEWISEELFPDTSWVSETEFLNAPEWTLNFDIYDLSEWLNNLDTVNLSNWLTNLDIINAPSDFLLPFESREETIQSVIDIFDEAGVSQIPLGTMHSFSPLGFRWTRNAPTIHEALSDEAKRQQLVELLIAIRVAQERRDRRNERNN